MDEELIRCLVTGVQCVNCSACYRDENVTVLGTYQDITFLSVYCPVCNRRDLMAVVLKDGEYPEVITDFTPGEYTKFCQMDAVNAGDVAALRDFLGDFSGDFALFFSDGDG